MDSLRPRPLERLGFLCAGFWYFVLVLLSPGRNRKIRKRFHNHQTKRKSFKDSLTFLELTEFREGYLKNHLPIIWLICIIASRTAGGWWNGKVHIKLTSSGVSPTDVSSTSGVRFFFLTDENKFLIRYLPWILRLNAFISDTNRMRKCEDR